MFRIGFLGAGNIAHVVANSLKDDSNLTLYAVASRDIEKAKTFCEKYGFQVAYGSYEELYSDPLVDLIYFPL